VLLAQLRVAPEGPRTGYNRNLFEHWVDEDGDGCNTRCEVLAAERHASLPGLPGGGWISIYDGYSTDDPQELDIDHVVALAEAWDSGASSWDAARRRAFANDLGFADSLIAVTAASNRAKGDKDPAEWQPSNRDAWCVYATAWINVKLRWDLTADQAEVRALGNMLRGCSGAPAPAPPATDPPAPAPPATNPPAPNPPANNVVKPGAYCTPVGATGVSSTGKPMICAETKANGEAYDRPRWRSP
jgi:hypothetical protein